MMRRITRKKTSKNNKSQLGNSGTSYVCVCDGQHFCELHCSFFVPHSTSRSFHGISHDSFPFKHFIHLDCARREYMLWHSFGGSICPAATIDGHYD